MSPSILFKGKIIPGHGRGKALGAPTLNLEVKENCPAHGIYAARVLGHPAALHIGPRPTFHEDDVSVEAHLLDVAAGQDLTLDFPQYGDTVEVEIVGWIREVEKFDSPEALKKQIEQVIVVARKLLE